MLSRGHWDSAGLLTLGEMAAGWHRACSPTPRGRRDTEGLRAPGAHSLPTAGTSQRCKFHFSPCKRIQGAKAASPGAKPPPPPRRPHWTPQPGRLAWGLEPARVTSCFPTSDSLSSLGDLGSRLAQVSWRQPGRGAADTGRGPLAREGPFSLGPRTLSGFTFGDAVNDHCFQPEALEEGWLSETLLRGLLSQDTPPTPLPTMPTLPVS